MPVFRSAGKLFYFAHIPKCGGSSVERYLIERFGNLGFRDAHFSALDVHRRWSRTSPQHIDWASLQRLLPAQFFDAVFAVVRHPVSRAVSAYHFQADVEKTINPEVSFPDWLRIQADALKMDPFTIDNHFRPQSDLIPNDCTIFYLEHGLDAIVPYLDDLVGNNDRPRSIGHKNKRSNINISGQTARAVPGPADLELIQQIYEIDFCRFGYVINQKNPNVAKPVLDLNFLKENAAEHARAARPINRLAARLKRKLNR